MSPIVVIVVVVDADGNTTEGAERWIRDDFF